MPREGFEPTIPAFKREKTVPALDHAATAIISAAILFIIIPLVTFPLRSQQKAVLRNLTEFINAEYIGCSLCRLIRCPEHRFGRHWFLLAN
jgi:hypothetical protein